MRAEVSPFRGTVGVARRLSKKEARKRVRQGEVEGWGGVGERSLREGGNMARVKVGPRFRIEFSAEQSQGRRFR